MKKYIITIICLLLVIFVVSDQKVRNNIKFDLASFKKVFIPTTVYQDHVMESFSKEQISQGRISPDNLVSGNIEKDDIPSLYNPLFDDSSTSQFGNDELIIGVFLNGEARAYPYSILNWHEIINDTIGDTPIAVTLCPLCDTNPVFIRIIDGKTTTFGVSGKLFNSCLVMHDRKTGTLWSQAWGIGILGEKVNYSLEKIIAHKTTLGDWKKKYPDTKILSTDTGHVRNYSRYPYGTYYDNDEIKFPVRNQDSLSTKPKEIISYIYQINNATPLNVFSGNSFQVLNKELKEKKTISFIFNNKNYSGNWDNELQSARFFDENNIEVPASTAFAFVYPAYFQ